MCLISALEGFHFANHPYIKYMGHGSTPVEAPKHEPKPEPVHEMPMMKDEMMMEKEMMKMDHPMPMSHHYQPYHAPNPTHYHQPYVSIIMQN